MFRTTDADEVLAIEQACDRRTALLEDAYRWIETYTTDDGLPRDAQKERSGLLDLIDAELNPKPAAVPDVKMPPCDFCGKEGYRYEGNKVTCIECGPLDQ